MYWSEKIDLIKKKFPVTDFKDPYRDGTQIIEKIIVKLFESTWLNFSQAENKATLLKQGEIVKCCTVKQLFNEELPKLKRDLNYWLLMLTLPIDSGYKVYDCKYDSIRELLDLSSGQTKQEFCIVDKKYAWLLYFKIDRIVDTVDIFSIGSRP